MTSPSVKFVKSQPAAADTGVIFVFDDNKLTPIGTELDKVTDGLVKRALDAKNGFGGNAGETLTIVLPEKAKIERVMICGLGDKKDFDEKAAEEIGGKLYAALKSSGARKVAVRGDKIKHLAHVAVGVRLRSYSFDVYKTKKKEKDAPEISAVSFLSDNYTEEHKVFTALDKVIDGVFFARDLVNEPPNVLYPDEYAKRIKKELEPLGVKVEILGEAKMKKLGMEALLSVGQGSARESKMVIMRWNGSGAKNKKPIGLVGKGVTFDTGGISLKPGAGMDEMKMDMGGSAAVVGTMKALAGRKSKANVVGIVGLVENMPSSNAYRPGDIIGSYKGKTIEVLNTDAEGRLVLVDCLTYIQDKYDPVCIVDLATLTGAMMVALGHEYCGTFVTDDKFWAQLEEAGAKTGEKIWRMPLDKAWMKDMESDVADVKNMGGSRYAGACTAAGFLQHFIDKDRVWAHMDIAGTAWKTKDGATTPKYATGFGVRVLDKLIENYSG